MNWGELLEVLGENFVHGHRDLEDTVTVYDASNGEYYPAELLVFEESDGIIDSGTMFISINAEAYNVQGGSEGSD
jgi:hypothetical protein